MAHFKLSMIQASVGDFNHLCIECLALLWELKVAAQRSRLSVKDLSQKLSIDLTAPPLPQLLIGREK
eukprot:2127766-Ditylum_brightwellii.AAC.1